MTYNVPHYAGRNQAIIWTNAVIMVTGSLVTNNSDVLIEIHIFPRQKIILSRPQCVTTPTSASESTSIYGNTWFHKHRMHCNAFITQLIFFKILTANLCHYGGLSCKSTQCDVTNGWEGACANSSRKLHVRVIWYIKILSLFWLELITYKCTYLDADLANLR